MGLYNNVIVMQGTVFYPTFYSYYTEFLTPHQSELWKYAGDIIGSSYSKQISSLVAWTAERGFAMTMSVEYNFYISLSRLPFLTTKTWQLTKQ